VPRKGYSLIVIGVDMAVCRLDKFTITKGVDNEFFFTIKASNSLMPMEIDSNDSILFKLVRLSDNTTVDISKQLVPVDRVNGKVRLFLTEAEVNGLLSDRGGKEHNYYLKPVYKIIIDADTAVNGQFVATLGKVYVG